MPLFTIYLLITFLDSLILKVFGSIGCEIMPFWEYSTSKSGCLYLRVIPLTLLRASLFGVAQRARGRGSKSPPLAKSLISIVEVWFSYQNATTSYFQSIKTICRAIKALFVGFLRYPKLLIIYTQTLLST